MLLINKAKPSDTSIVKPQITSLIDVMTILLVFLMKSFSVEGNIVTPSDYLTLPLSTSREIPAMVTTLEITDDAVRCEEDLIVRHQSFIESDSLFIPELGTWLLHNASSRNSEVMLQADRKVPFTILKRIMYTCNRTGRDNFTILVQQEE